MSDRFSGSDTPREALSALADGEAQSAEVARACAAWKDQPDARATWHAYQMIGDVMRSDDLAQASRGDQFLQSFRARLAQEPVILSPGLTAAQRAAIAEVLAVDAVQPLRRRTWAGPAAVAAGFVLMVSGLIGLQVVPGVTPSIEGSLAQSGSMFGEPVQGTDLGMALSPGVAQLEAVGVVGDVQAPGVAQGASFMRPETGDTALIRDPRLEQALAAHPRNAPAGDASFAGQGGMTQSVVYIAR